MAVGDYIFEIQTSDGNTHPIGSSVWVSEKEWNGKTITEVETEIKTKFSNLTEITWSSLKSLVDKKSLIPGMYYRITDYQCTTTQENTISAGHQFDIIARADDINVLNEECWAACHEGDEYFVDSNLSAWKLWYCLDNDIDRFEWADSTNGKGVIYRMIDEWNNDVPYDFKNIRFKHPNNNTEYPDYYYTFSYVFNNVATDYSLIQGNCYNNIIKDYIKVRKQCLNNNVFLNTSGNSCYSNSFGNDCNSNSFGDACFSNSFGDDCYSNSFGNTCYSNSFGDACFSNSFGDDCYSNSFGNTCYSNSFGNTCYSNSFGNSCYSNSFGDTCHSNSFGNSCDSNSFGNGCDSNSFGNSCYSNSFGNNCKSNSFENTCYSNSFGDTCHSNSFGNDCNSNSFGDACFSNSFGNSCHHIRFASDSSASTKYHYYQNNHFGEGCQYIVFTGTETASNSTQVQNYNFTQGLKGTSSTYLTIDGKRNRSFETKVAKNSNAELKIYCEADLIL